MSIAQIVIRALGAVLALLGCLYAIGSAIFYAWLNAAEPERWPADRAAPWAYGSLAIAALLLAACVWFSVATHRAIAISRNSSNGNYL